MKTEDQKARAKTKGRYFDFRGFTKEQKRSLALFAVLLCALFLTIALVVFFSVLRGPERVMVPDVRGKELADALISLQERELYPRLSLRFTDNPLDRNTILEQSPGPGSIVKAGRRIKLSVSRGAVLEKVEDYRGKDLETLKLQLQSLFSSSKALLTIREPALYRWDEAAPGTILEQKPEPGTGISGPTVLELVVSKGPEAKKVAVPDFTGLGIQAGVDKAETSPMVVDFEMRPAKQGESFGVVVAQKPEAGAEAKATDRLLVTLSAPQPSKGTVSGIYKYTLPTYPYPVDIRLEAVKPSGQTSLLGAFKHPGGQFSLPFSLPSGSAIVLYALDRELARTEVKE
ncbi:MAG TPA: PASTA domain-containing protein [Rectinemataceae bacterium]